MPFSTISAALASFIARSFSDHPVSFLLSALAGFLCMNCFYIAATSFTLPVCTSAVHNAAVEMHHAALPLRLRIEIRQVLDQAEAFVGDEQLDPFSRRAASSRAGSSSSLARSSFAPSPTARTSRYPVCETPIATSTEIVLYLAAPRPF